jgi:hypothetical protein
MAQLQATGITGSLAITGNMDTVNYTLTHVARGNLSGTQAINITSGSYVSATATAAITWSFAGAPASTKAAGFVLELTNGGAFAQTWPATVRWPEGIAPTLTASGIDVLTFVTDDGGTNWRGVLSMLDSKAP